MPNVLQVATTVTISSGASISAGFETQGMPIVGILCDPTAWTAAGITFQASEPTGTTYGNVYDPTGTEVAVTISTASYAIIQPSDYASCYGSPYVRIRSGTSGSPVTQGGVRTLTIIQRNM